MDFQYFASTYRLRGQSGARNGNLHVRNLNPASPILKGMHNARLTRS
jgi:hypothetical protein